MELKYNDSFSFNDEHRMFTKDYFKMRGFSVCTDCHSGTIWLQKKFQSTRLFYNYLFYIIFYHNIYYALQLVVRVFELSLLPSLSFK
jgi:hypothetical protein